MVLYFLDGSSRNFHGNLNEHFEWGLIVSLKSMPEVNDEDDDDASVEVCLIIILA